MEYTIMVFRLDFNWISWFLSYFLGLEKTWSDGLCGRRIWFQYDITEINAGHIPANKILIFIYGAIIIYEKVWIQSV